MRQFTFHNFPSEVKQICINFILKHCFKIYIYPDFLKDTKLCVNINAEYNIFPPLILPLFTSKVKQMQY